MKKELKIKRIKQKINFLSQRWENLEQGKSFESVQSLKIKDKKTALLYLLFIGGYEEQIEKMLGIKNLAKNPYNTIWINSKEIQKTKWIDFEFVVKN